MKLHNQQKGIGLIEAMIAAIVFAVGVAAVVQLQGKFFKEGSAANNRSTSMSIAQEKIEDLRGFQVTDSPVADVFDYTDICTPGTNICISTTNHNNFGGGRCTEQLINGVCNLALPSGSVTKDNVIYNRSWSVTPYYYNNAGVLTTTANGGIVQKKVTVTVNWTDPDGVAQAAHLDGVISSTASAAATGGLVNNIGGSGQQPEVPYTPSTDSRVTPIGVGTDTKRETLVPSSQTVNGYTRTKFTANTYTTGGKLVREEEFQNIACDCRFNGTSSSSSPTYSAAHPGWSTDQDTYIDVDGEQVSGKAQGCVQGGGSNCASNSDTLCNSCCQDHHDISSVNRKYDPFRSSDDFTSAGDHKHYHGSAPVTSGQYLEACRMKRVNGYWRVYQDWNMVDLTVLPLSDLIDTTIKAVYAGYVKSIIDQHLDENKVSGQDLGSPPAEPSILNHTISTNYVTMNVTDKRDLTARAIYLDYIDSTHLAAVKNKKAAGVDYLLHLPFYEIEVASVVNWISSNAAKVNVGPYNGSGSSHDLYGGQLEALANTNTAANVTGSIKKSNSGISALDLAVDYNAATNPDSQIHGDFVSVCVGCTAGNCSLPWGGSVVNNAAVTAYQSSMVAYGSSCVSQSRNCSSGTLSGTYQYESCTVNPAANCTFNGTSVSSGDSVTAYQAATVISPSACASESRSCANGMLSGSYGYASCTDQGSGACTTAWGVSVVNGGTATAYQAATAAYGTSCVSQVQTCTGGTMSPNTYPYGTCTVNAPASCTFNGVSVTSGNSVAAYQAATVISPSTCVSESRACVNGTLSGTYSYSSCSVQAATICSSTVSGKKQGNNTYTMTINGGTAIACPVSGSSYTCPTSTVNISGTTIVITSSSNTTQSIVSPNVCGAVTANF
jgi:Tfp pilus assembly protein PilV